METMTTLVCDPNIRVLANDIDNSIARYADEWTLHQITTPVWSEQHREWVAILLYYRNNEAVRP